MKLLERIDWSRPRTYWLGSWLFAGGLIVLSGIFHGAVPLGAFAGMYCGFGAGVELTLFLTSWRQRALVQTVVQTADNISTKEIAEPVDWLKATDEVEAGISPDKLARQDQYRVVEALEILHFSKKDAKKLAAGTPANLPPETRVAMALQGYRIAQEQQ